MPEIVGFEEEMFNANEATTSEPGRTKRSSHKANKIPKGRLGALVLKYGDTTFNCGTGFNDAERERIWLSVSAVGQFAKIKYHVPTGSRTFRNCLRSWAFVT